MNSLISAKNFFTKNKGWIVVLIGILISIVGSLILAPFKEPLSKLMKPLVSFLDYDVRLQAMTLPYAFLTSIVTSLSTVFIISNLIYILSTHGNIAIERFFGVFVSFTKKYLKEIGIFLVLPKAILDVLSQILITIIVDKMMGGLISSMFMSYSHPFKYWFLTRGIIIIFAAICVLINTLCTIKFATLIEEISFDAGKERGLYLLAIIVAVTYGLISLIPVVGVIIGFILLAIYNVLFGCIIIVATRNFSVSPLSR